MKKKWEEVRAEYQDQWVLFDEWDEDEFGDIVAGHVAFHSTDRLALDSLIAREYQEIHLAIRYTGDVKGPFLLP